MTDRAISLSNRLNAMKPGQCMWISREDLQDLPSRIYLDESGWKRVLENVIGSTHNDLWSFNLVPGKGDMIVTRNRL